MAARFPARRDKALDGSRAERTRSAILAASRELFLQRGYAGTPVNAITEACGISNASFYTYFPDKRKVFNVLGWSAYLDMLAVLDRWRDFAPSDGPDWVQDWVWQYFAYMDVHGAFVMTAAHSAPDDDAFERSRNRMVTIVTRKLGQALPGDGGHSTETIGVAVMALLDRSWYAVYQQTVPVERDDVIAAVAEVLFAMTGAGTVER
jgi:AcrR family transcriptional regulator